MLVPDLAVSGGSQKLTLRVAVELSRKGHQVAIYTPNLDKKNCYPNIFKTFSKINVLSLNKKGSTKNIVPTMFDDIAPLTIKYYALSKKIGPSDILIVQDEECLTSLPFLKWHQNKFASAVWMMNNQLEKNHFEFKKKIVEHLRNINNIRVVPYILLTLPAVMIDTFFKICGLKHVDKIACYDSFNSGLVKQILHRESDIVFAGADLDEYKQIRAMSIRKGESIRMLSVGVMFRYRRYEDIITAIYLLKRSGMKITLSLVGRSDYDKVYYRKLKRLVEKHKLTQNIAFYEFLDQKKLFSLYKNSHIFCFVNNAHTWGISAFEAVATGMPVIITNNIGAADIIKNGESGWVVPPKNPKAIALAIKNIINNPKQTKKITSAAKHKVVKLLSWRAFTNRLLPEA